MFNNPAPDPFLQPEASGRSPWLIILIALLAVGAVLFGLLAIVGFHKAGVATKSLQQQKTAAATAARDDQQKLDANVNEKASESPYRSYVAPLEYGSFEIQFPKNWSADVTESRSGVNQVDLILNPNFVKTVNSVDDKRAARVTLVQRTLNDYLKQYISLKTLNKTDVTVAGIASVQLTGTFPDKRTARMVAVPVRDKTLVFVNEDTKYDPELTQILAQAKINP